MRKKTYTVVRIPDNDWGNLMETVTLDGSYSDEIKNEVWTAVENVQFYSNPWVVVRISGGKSIAKIFSKKDFAQEYLIKERKKLKPNEQIFCVQGQYK
ncbi:MAG: hypothetical protein AABZ00_16490 [Chloroflexota bacterium]